MSHQAVREFISDVAVSLADDVLFGYGRASDFNMRKDKEYPYVWLDPLQSTIAITGDGRAFTETYNVSLSFYKFDSMDSTEDQYKLILDQVDVLVQTFIRKLNENIEAQYEIPTVLATYNTEITNINKSPFIKVFDDCLTGFILSFSLTVPDNFDYCSIYGS